VSYGLSGFVVLSAVIFALSYRAILEKLTIVLVSPYPKADVARRLSAATVDGLLVLAGLALYLRADVLLYLFAAALYLVLRDAMWGRSPGKFLFGLVVVNLETGGPCASGGSFRRNALLLLPGANVVAIFLEAATIVRDPQGQRLGDRFAQTQVVEGLGVKDVIAAVQDWWRDFLGHLDGNVRRPRRLPVRRSFPKRGGTLRR
jgi:uncharacterized RDD family membrane protein YckC